MALDLIRGYSLVVITVEHLARFPSLLDPVTGRDALWLSGAEFFMFISGFLLGALRGREVRGGSWRKAAEKLWRRALVLYLAILAVKALVVAGRLVARHAGVSGGATDFSTGTDVHTLLRIATLQAGGTDILVDYVVFLLAAPLVLLALRRRLAPLVLVASVALFVVASPPHFHLLWQIYFFGGMVIGYHRDVVARLWQRYGAPHRWLQPALVLACLATLAVSVVLDYLPSGGTRLVSTGATYDALFHDERFGLLRPVVFALWFAALFLVVQRWEPLIAGTVGRLLVPLGRNPLYVYLLQILLLTGLNLLPGPRNLLANTAAALLAIGLLWLAVRRRFLFGIIPR